MDTFSKLFGSLLFILFHKRVCGPLENSLFHHRPEDRSPHPAKIERAYHEADVAVQHLIDLLAPLIFLRRKFSDGAS